jgi:hypothetical protein
MKKKTPISTNVACHSAVPTARRQIAARLADAWLGIRPPAHPETQVRLRARIRFYSLLKLRDRLRERFGKRHLLCVIVVRTQPLAESLANAAVRRAIEQWRIIRCHDMLLRKADAPAVYIGGTMRADRFRPNGVKGP